MTEKEVQNLIDEIIKESDDNCGRSPRKANKNSAYGGASWKGAFS